MSNPIVKVVVIIVLTILGLKLAQKYMPSLTAKIGF